MANLLYGACAVTALLCAWLLLQAYVASRYRILLWGGLCFAGLTINNLLLVIDKVYVPLIDLSSWRLWTALLSMLVLLYGLIWESE